MLRHGVNWALVLCTAFLLGVGGGRAVAQPVLDYGQEEFAQGRIVALRGQADFHWQLLLTPQEFAHDAEPETPINIPGDWAQGSLQASIGEQRGHGFGTYHFKLKLPQQRAQSYGLLMPLVHGSWRLWIDGTLRQEVGVVSSLPTALGSRVQTALIPFTPRDTVGGGALVDVVVQVSNYCECQGGLVYAPLVGSYDALARRTHRTQAMQYILFGMTLVLALFLLLPGPRGRHNRSRYLVVAALLLVAFNSLSTGMPYRPTVYVGLGWRVFYILQYSLLLASTALTLLYIGRERHRPQGRGWLLSLGIAGFVLMLGPVVLPGASYTWFTALYQGYVLLVVLLLLVLRILPQYWLRRGARWVLYVGVCCFALGMIVDHLVIPAVGWSLQSWQQVGTVLLVGSVLYLKLHALGTQWRISRSLLMRCKAQNDRLGGENDRLARQNDSLTRAMEELNEERAHRGWQDEGLKMVRQALSPLLEGLESRCQVGLEAVTRYVRGNVAALYMARFDVATGGLMLRMAASYGFTAEERAQLGSVAIGEGLVGACFADNTFEHLTTLDGCPFQISSGLGRTVPPALVLAPLNSEAGTIGVLEVGRLEPFAPYELSFLRQAAMLVAINLMLTQTREQDQVHIKSLMQTIAQKERTIAEMAAQNQELQHRLAPDIPTDGLF